MQIEIKLQFLLLFLQIFSSLIEKSKCDYKEVSTTRRYNDLFSKSGRFLLETRRNWISTSTQILGWGWKWDWEQEYSSEKAMR